MTRVLCVEDEHDIREDIVEALEDFGHTVAAAANGQEGLELAEAFRPEIIVCDCLMPVMTGTELIAALREREDELSETPFVFLSAHAEREHKAAGLGAGADVYLTKPIDYDVLESVLSELAGRNLQQ